MGHLSSNRILDFVAYFQPTVFDFIACKEETRDKILHNGRIVL